GTTPPDTHPSTFPSDAQCSHAPCAGSPDALAVLEVTTAPLVPAATPAQDFLGAAAPGRDPSRPVHPVAQPARSARDTSPCAVIATVGACRYRRSRRGRYRSCARYTPTDIAHN